MYKCRHTKKSQTFLGIKQLLLTPKKLPFNKRNKADFRFNGSKRKNISSVRQKIIQDLNA